MSTQAASASRYRELRPPVALRSVVACLWENEPSAKLQQRIVATVGYGPKMLARVARLRRLIALPDDPLAARAFEAGYAGQAHMNDEVRRLTGLTPVRFLEDATLTAA